MEIINPHKTGDFHIHSSTYSDGFSSIDEIVIAAGKLEYQTIAITDHSQALMDSYGIARKTHYEILASGRWSNIHNNVEVLFGVEADLLNKEGDICNDIQGIIPDYVILSAHGKLFNSDFKHIKIAYLNAIDRFGKDINVLGHLCSKRFAPFLRDNELIQVIDAANASEIAFELNCSNLIYDKTDLKNLNIMLEHADYIYVNSDAHTMNEFKNLRKKGFQYLETKHSG